MQIEIDQSNKVEQKSNNTVIAYANSKQKSLMIPARYKRELQKLFRKANKPQMFRYKIFALLVYLLIKDDLKLISSIIIDNEYTGREDLIKNYLLQFLKIDGKFFSKDNIHFDLIGRESNAHKRAIAVLRGNIQTDIIVGIKNLLPYLI